LTSKRARSCAAGTFRTIEHQVRADHDHAVGLLEIGEQDRALAGTQRFAERRSTRGKEPGFPEPPGGVVLAADSARPEPEPFEERVSGTCVRVGSDDGLPE
jgi:hypothetical protein